MSTEVKPSQQEIMPSAAPGTKSQRNPLARLGTRSSTIASILSAVDAMDDSSDEDDHDTHREATNVEEIQDLIQQHPFSRGGGHEEPVCFRYKGRNYKGSLLHVAALDLHSSKLVKKLLSAEADVGEFAIGEWPGVAKQVKVLPIHLAAASGSMESLRCLINSRAKPDAPSQHDGIAHYTALHNAVFFSHTEAVFCLLRLRANVEAKNIKGETPLNLAVRSHDLPVIKQLVKARADCQAKAKRGETIDELAMQFCHDSLAAVCEKSMSTLVRAARVGAEENIAYKAILGRDNKLKPSWQKALKNEAETDARFVEQIIELCGLSALAATTVLDGLSIEPEPEDTEYEAPKNGAVPTRFFPTTVRPDVKWPNPTKEMHNLKWMTELCKMKLSDIQKPFHCDGDDHLVSVKAIRVRGLLCPRFLEAIADSNEESLVTAIVPSAAMSFCWMHFARYTAIASSVYKALAVVLMTCSVALKIDSMRAPLLNQACWNGFAAIVLFEVSGSLVSLAMFLQQVICEPTLETARLNVQQLCESVFNGVSVYMIWISAQEGFDLCANPSLAAVTLMVRWLLLAWSLRTVDGIGQKLLPIILASFEPVKGVLLVAFFGFLAFFTAFLALGSEGQDVDVLAILINTMRLLLLSDGDGIDAVLKVFPADSDAEDAEFKLVGVLFLAAAIFMFVIVILNLLIAAYGEASLKDGEVAFRRQLARVCCDAWNKPSWPFGFSSLRVPNQSVRAVYFTVILLGVLGWSLLFYLAHDHPAICGWLALALFVGDLVLNQKPWPSATYPDPESSYLWMCHPTKLEHEHHQHIHRQGFQNGHDKKLVSRLDMRHRKLHRKMEQMMIEIQEMIGDTRPQVDGSKAHGHEQAQPPKEAGAEAVRNDLFCTHCGNRYTANARFCAHCGQTRSEVEQPSAPLVHSELRVVVAAVAATLQLQQQQQPGSILE